MTFNPSASWSMPVIMAAIGNECFTEQLADQRTGLCNNLMLAHQMFYPVGQFELFGQGTA